MSAPQVILLVLITLGWGMAGANHGKPRDNWHVGWATVSFLILVGLLWWGGFWE